MSGGKEHDTTRDSGSPTELSDTASQGSRSGCSKTSATKSEHPAKGPIR